MRRFAPVVFCIACFAFSASSQRYLSDILQSDFDKKFADSATTLSVNYWRYDTCLYQPKKICIYNTATGTRVRVKEYGDMMNCRMSFSSHNVYKGQQADNVYDYYFSPASGRASWMIRSLCLERKEKGVWTTYMRRDSFSLKLIDSLTFSSSSLIKNVFDEPEISGKLSLLIYVLESTDPNGSRMFHFWVERIGIIKLTDEKCWRYSFEVDEREARTVEKLFSKLYSVIKEKYKDPHWSSEPCSFE